MKINLRKKIEPMSLKYNLSDLPTGSESRQSHVEFIRVNLELMLAVAWNGYESEGRGAIVMPLESEIVPAIARATKDLETRKYLFAR